MYSKFPFSMENIPRQKSFACLSLKLGCVFSALLIILYSVLSLAQCTAAISEQVQHTNTDNTEAALWLTMLVTVAIYHAFTLFLTAIMLVGTLRERPHLMRPWVIWTSIQVIFYLLLFIFWTTIAMVSHAGGSSVLVYALEFLSLMLRFYMLMLVASYYKQLEEERFDGEHLKTLENQDTWYQSTNRQDYDGIEDDL